MGLQRLRLDLLRVIASDFPQQLQHADAISRTAALVCEGARGSRGEVRPHDVERAVANGMLQLTTRDPNTRSASELG